MAKVFISYRREDTAGEARALFNDLTANLGEGSIFMDVDNIALGRDFRQAIHERLASCDILLALIGDEWIDAKNPSGQRRLDDSSDFVRLEIAAALKRNIPVTPVLLQGAQMPIAERMPEEIRDLAYRNGFELSHSRWTSDVQEMVRRLGLNNQEDMRTTESVDAPVARSAVKPFAENIPIETRVMDSGPGATIQKSNKFWLAIVTALTLVLVILGGWLYYIKFAGQEEAQHQTLLSKICPIGYLGCSRDNKCTSCDSTCKFCQSKEISSCERDDCMACNEGHQLEEIYAVDGTGICRPDS